MDAVTLLQQLINGLSLGSLYALIAIGYTMVYGILRLINFAHGDLLMVAAYVGVMGVALFSLPWLLALGGFCLTVPEGGLYGLIGPNGAGKTTVFNILSGFLKPSQGEVFFKGHNITGWPPHQITALGLARTFQNIRLFGELSVLDNVLVGEHCRGRAAWWEAVLRLPRYGREEQARLAQGLALLEEVGLREVAAAPASKLPYVTQRRPEIARALATRPRFLLLDEPAAGLNPQETLDLIKFLKEVRDHYRLTLLVIEHNLRLVMGLCEHLTVLDHGLIIAAGAPHEVRKNPEVVRAYLGAN